MIPAFRGTVRVFLTTAVVLVASLAFAHYAGALELRDGRTVVRERAVLAQLGRFLATVTDAETGQRGYLLTGDLDDLGPYEQAVRDVQDEMHGLSELATHGVLPLATVEALHDLTDRKMAELDATVELRRAGRLDDAVARVKQGPGKDLMLQIRAHVAELTEAKEAALAEALHDSDTMTWIRTLVWTLSVMLNLAFLAWAYRRISREVARC